MKGSINIIKLIMAIYIFVFHAAYLFNYPYFQGGYIYVEWFFVFIGYTLMKRIDSMPQNVDIPVTTFEVIYKRIRRLIPYYFLSTFIALIVKLHFRQVIITSSWDVSRIMHEFLMLQMTTISVISLTGTSWFLSSMWIAMIVIVPILLKLRKYVCIPAIIVSTIIYLYLYKKSGYLWGPTEWFITYKGNLRAIAAILLGVFGYGFSPVIKDYLKRFKNNIKLIKILVLCAYLLVFYYTAIIDQSKYYFVIPYIFMILIAVNMSFDDDIIVSDNKITRFIGDISMVLYMNHFYVMKLFEVTFYNRAQRVFYSLVFSVAFSLFVYSVVYLFSNHNNLKLISNLRQFLKK